MTADTGFSRALGVVRVRVDGAWLATLPRVAADAKAYATKVKRDVAVAGDFPTLVEFEADTEWPCWIRARDVRVVDVVPTDDPSIERWLS